MPMADTIATAADYADAMMTARKAKNLLFLLLLLVLLTQLAIFFVAGYTDYVVAHDTTIDVAGNGTVATTLPSTAPTTGETGVEINAENAKVTLTATNDRIQSLLRWFIGVCNFIGVILPIVLAS